MIQYANEPIKGMAQIIRTHIASVVPLNFFFPRLTSETIGKTNNTDANANWIKSKPVLIPSDSIVIYPLIFQTVSRTLEQLNRDHKIS